MRQLFVFGVLNTTYVGIFILNYAWNSHYSLLIATKFPKFLRILKNVDFLMIEMFVDLLLTGHFFPL